MKKRPEFSLYGIFGYPLAHTLSPAMQEAAFRSLGLKAFYLALELDPGHFRKVMRGSRRLLLDGFNVTVPHKETVMRFLARVSPEAGAIGAVNTVYREKGRWVGTNTDACGFLTALEKDAGFRARDKKVLILGAGGGTRAAAYALAGRGAREIRIANRHPERARRIIRDFRPLFRDTLFKACGLAGADLTDALREADLVVNATSVGLKPGDTPLLPLRLIPKAGAGKRMLFFDLIYRPAMTRFLKQAKGRGHRVMNGLGMLLYQGARAFEYWTGKKAPLSVMRKALLEELDRG